MQYTKQIKPSDKCKQLVFIWGDDGWCYIPELKMRLQITETHYFHEKWDGVIAMPEFVEKVSWRLLSEKPRVWQENDELYSQTITTP